MPVLIKVAVDEEPLDKAELDLEGEAEEVARRAAAIREDVQQRALGLLGEALAGLPGLPGVTLPGVASHSGGRFG